MIGLAYLGFFTLYFLLTILAVYWGYRFAKRKYQKGWLGGVVAFLLMYHLVFWDFIPVLIMHKYYCSTQAGYWVYKTPEEWVEEHPEVWGQDWSDSIQWKRESLSDTYRYQRTRANISNDIYYEYEKDLYYSHAIISTQNKIYDSKSNEILAKMIDYETGSPGLYSSGSHIKGYSIWQWIYGGHCLNNDKKYEIKFYKEYLDKIILIVKNKM